MMKIVVKAETGGLEKAMKNLESQSRGAASYTASMREDFLTMARASQTIAQNMKSFGKTLRTGGSGGGGGSAGVMKAPPKLSAQAIVNQMGIQGAMHHYGPAAMQGNLFASRVVNSAVSSQKAIQRAQGALNPQPQDPMAMILQTFMRTRFASVGGKMLGMPLGVDIMKMIRAGQGSALSGMMGGIGGAGGAGMGAGGAAMGLLLNPVTLLAAGFAGLVTATKLTADAFQGLREAALSSGGNAGQSGVLSSIGLNPRGIVDAAMSTGLGRLEMNKAGNSLLPRELGGNLDSNAAAMKLIEAIRNAPDDRAARMMAERMGSPELVQARQWSKSQFSTLKGIQGTEFEQGIQTITRFNLQMELFKIRMIEASAPLMGFVDSFIVGMEKMSAGMEWVNNRVREFMQMMDGIWAPAAQRGQNQGERIARAVEKTAKIQETMYREGFSGGGSRATRAIPGRWQGTAKLDGYSTIDDVKLGLY